MKAPIYCSFIFLCFGSYFSCKKTEVTNSPMKSADPVDIKPVITVTGEEVVDLDQVPLLKVALNLKDCLGKSRWKDPTPGVDSRSGAVSLAPRVIDAADSTQPDAKVFQPNVPVDEADSTSQSKATYTWRIRKSKYAMELIAYSYKNADTKTESSLMLEFDLSSGREISYTIEGLWQNGLCKLITK